MLDGPFGRREEEENKRIKLFGAQLSAISTKQGNEMNDFRELTIGQIETQNSSQLLPEKVFRRNFKNYPFVSLVNNLLCLFLSKNFEVALIFIYRIQVAIQQLPELGKTEYTNQLTKYLMSVKEKIRENTAGNELWSDTDII